VGIVVAELGRWLRFSGYEDGPKDRFGTYRVGAPDHLESPEFHPLLSNKNKGLTSIFTHAAAQETAGWGPRYRPQP
jgi:hypothetical protein